MLRHKLFQLFFLVFSTIIYSQNTCPNSNFGLGNFDNWIGYTGDYLTPNNTFGIVNGRHTIITAQGTDPSTCGGLQMIPPGETQSCRLGNSFASAEAEVLSYTISVTPQNTLFIYKYAVVLEDPGHSPSQQPQFEVKIIDSGDNQIDPLCGIYNVYSGQSGQNFQICGGVNWLPWNTVALNLTPYIGTNVKIQFTTKDCSLGGHFGYAYISAKCATLKGSIKICQGSSNFVLSAPSGFSGYEWSFNGTVLGTTQNLTLPLGAYAIGDTFDCKLTSYSNGNQCTANIQVELTASTIITPDFSVTPNCNSSILTGIPVNFTDLSTIQNANSGQWQWDFGDGNTSTSQNPVHIYTNPGNYTVTLNVISDTGCAKSISKNNIIVLQNPTQQPNINSNQLICSTPPPTLLDINNNGQNLIWYASPTSLTPLNSNTLLSNGTTYYCAVSTVCNSPRVAVTVNLTQSPTAQINYLGVFCNTISNQISCILTGTNNYLNGTYSASPNGLFINNTTGAITPNQSLPGNYTVTYTIPSRGNCPTVTTTTNITIFEVPKATINYSSTTFCNALDQNQPVILTGTGNYNNGVFSSSPSGLSLDANGNINPSLSQIGNYTVTYTFTSPGNCTTIPATFNVSIIESQAPIGNSPQEFCKIDKPKVNDLTATGNNIKWYSSPNGGSPLSNSTLLVNGDTYFASQTDPITGCESLKRLAIKVKIFNNTSDLREDYTDDFCLETNPTLANLTMHTANIVYFENANSTNQLPLNTPLVNNHTYYAAMIDPVSKCESVERTAIHIEILPCELIVYNNITINNNNLNDYLGIKNIEYFEDNDIEIYNRFGQLVYKAKKYGFDNTWFKGEANSGDLYLNNKFLPTGTYYYIFRYRKESVSIDTTKKGFIYIINNNE